VSINDIPKPVLQSALDSISTFTIGFAEIVRDHELEDVQLLGTGTLIKVGKNHGILTAQHVLKALPKEGRLGLIMSRSANRETVNISGITYIDIARGTNDQDGPDLALVLLSPSIASTIAARKNFYDLNIHREKALINPPDLQYGVWCNIGFIDEKTIEKPGEKGYTKIKVFFMQAGFGGPEKEPYSKDGFDYISLPVTYNSSPDIPINFGGISGGGVWQVQLIRGTDNEMTIGELLLSGVVFYQEALANDRRNLICHYRKSVYNTAYTIIEKNGH